MHICKQNCGKFTFDAILKANELHYAIVSKYFTPCFAYYLWNYDFCPLKEVGVVFVYSFFSLISLSIRYQLR